MWMAAYSQLLVNPPTSNHFYLILNYIPSAVGYFSYTRDLVTSLHLELENL